MLLEASLATTLAAALVLFGMTYSACSLLNYLIDRAIAKREGEEAADATNTADA